MTRTPRGPAPDRRSGIALGELLVALTISGIVVTVALGSAEPSSAASDGIERHGAICTGSYAIGALERDLQTLGTHLSADGPAFVYADAHAVVFSVDPLGEVDGGPSAFAQDRVVAGRAHAETGSPANPITAHAGDRVESDVSSVAETLSFSFLPDVLTSRADDFVLVRQVDGGPPDVLGRHLLRVEGRPFIEFHRAAIDGTDDGRLGAHALRVTLRGSNGLLGDDERTVETSRIIVLSNSHGTELDLIAPGC